MKRDGNSTIVLGKITAAFGIKGWVKIHSYTDPADNLFSYEPLQLRHQDALHPVVIEKFQPHGRGFIAQIQQIKDRDSAESYRHASFEIESRFLPELDEDEFYWAELEGMQVFNQEKESLGYVQYLFNAGASDVMVVKGDEEHLIPFLLRKTVLCIDKKKRIINVDWHLS